MRLVIVVISQLCNVPCGPGDGGQVCTLWEGALVSPHTTYVCTHLSIFSIFQPSPSFQRHSSFLDRCKMAPKQSSVPNASGQRARRRHYAPGQQQLRADRRVSESRPQEEPEGTKRIFLWS